MTSLIGHQKQQAFEHPEAALVEAIPLAGLLILADFLVEKPTRHLPKTSVVEIPTDPVDIITDESQWTYVAKEENMVKYLEKAKSLISGFANFSISQVPRSKNKKVDALSKIASTQPLRALIQNETLPDDRKEASKLHIKARQYELLEGVLYRRSFLKPWLRCVGLLQANYVIREIHEGSCRKVQFLIVLWTISPSDRGGKSRGDNIWQSEAVIPAEIRMPTYRTAVVDAVHNDEELRLNLDLLEERHEHAAIREAKAKLKMTKYYNARVRGVTFRPGDFVYRSNEASHAMDRGKLGPK
ncbi:reverse transcriptase domain-containing protein [Tanacetum coccineum]|uniref:Reverse transcriptase domain-containing protein n=1 Tax=Tanacetum coccineum TaxID=301880 RepID=A0ABQ5HZY5_9ASTR